jgi:hypothetical protein
MIATYLEVPHKAAASWRRHLGGGENGISREVGVGRSGEAR